MKLFRLMMLHFLHTYLFKNKLQEIQRLSSIITTNLTRYTSEDVEIGGVLIRKGIPCTAQLSMILSDERYFPEPEKVKNH